MMPWLLIVLGLVSLAPASKAQQITDCVVLDNSACPETSPEHDIVFQTPARDICVPSEDKDGKTIITLLVKLTGSPNCVRISGASSVVDKIDLTSCFSNNLIILVSTRALFSEADSGEFDFIVDDQTSTIEYRPKGIHLTGNDSFNVSSKDFPLLVARSYFAGAPTAKELCVENEDRSLVTATEFELEVVEPSHDELSCVSDVALTSQDRVLEYKIRNKDGMSPAPGEYHLLVASTSCEDASLKSPIFTLHVEGSDTPTPGPTPLPSSTRPPGKGGTNVAAIAGGVTGAIGVILIIILLVSLIIIVSLRKRALRKPQQGSEDLPLGNVETTPRTPEIKEPPPVVAPLKRVVLLNTASRDSKLGPALAHEEGGQFEEFLTPGAEEDRGWYSRHTNFILNSDHYGRLYIIYRESPEALRESYPLVWGIWSEIKTRPYSYDVLQKVVFVQVVSSDRAGEGSKLVDDLPFIITESKLEDSSQLACLIHSKVRMKDYHKHVNINSLRNVPSDEVDEGMLESQSPGSSPGPHSRGRDGKKSEDSMFPSNPTSGPPSYTSQPTSQPGSLPLERVRDVPVPEVAEEPMHSESQKELISQLKKMNLTQEQIRDELKKQTELQQKTAENTGRTADNTGDMRENLEETRLTINEANDMLQGRNVSEDQPNLS